jgi:hypothetical protein
MWPFVRHGDEGESPSDGRRIMDAPQRTITGIATVGIPVTDQDRALRFYTETLGMEKRLDDPLPQFGGRWITVRACRFGTSAMSWSIPEPSTSKARASNRLGRG